MGVHVNIQTALPFRDRAVPNKYLSVVPSVTQTRAKPPIANAVPSRSPTTAWPPITLIAHAASAVKRPVASPLITFLVVPSENKKKTNTSENILHH